jgi:hypothetical protein
MNSLIQFRLAWESVSDRRVSKPVFLSTSPKKCTVNSAQTQKPILSHDSLVFWQPKQFQPSECWAFVNCLSEVVFWIIAWFSFSCTPVVQSFDITSHLAQEITRWTVSIVWIRWLLWIMSGYESFKKKYSKYLCRGLDRRFGFHSKSHHICFSQTEEVFMFR